MPAEEHVGVSQRIDDEQERERLKQLVQQCMEGEGLSSSDAGFIVRTAAEGVGADEILADTRYLRRLWRKLESVSATTKLLRWCTTNCHCHCVPCAIMRGRKCIKSLLIRAKPFRKLNSS